MNPRWSVGGGGLSPTMMNMSTMVRDDTTSVTMAVGSRVPGAERSATCREPVCTTYTQRHLHWHFPSASATGRKGYKS